MFHPNQSKPAVLTELGVAMLRARLSLRETQAEFAKHFRVTVKTVNNWERGRSTRTPAIYTEILAKIIAQLQANGQLLLEEQLQAILRKALLRHNSADGLNVDVVS